RDDGLGLLLPRRRPRDVLPRRGRAAARSGGRIAAAGRLPRVRRPPRPYGDGRVVLRGAAADRHRARGSELAASAAVTWLRPAGLEPGCRLRQTSQTRTSVSGFAGNRVPTAWPAARARACAGAGQARRSP